MLDTSPARTEPGIVDGTESPEKKLLKCRHCGKEYLFDTRHLNGRAKARFQCSRCDTVFEQSFQAEEDKNEENNERSWRIPPFAVTSSAVTSFAVLLAASALFLIGLTFIHAPGTSKILEVSDPAVTQSVSNDGTLYTFSGTIKNPLNSALSGINVEVQLFSEDSRLLSAHRIRLMPGVSMSRDSSVQVPASTLRRAADQMTFASGEEVKFSVPILVHSPPDPAYFTIRAFTL